MQTLQRRLGIPAASAIGVASMLGAGIFFVWAPATAAAGTAVIVALPLAAGIAILNALSTTRLAILHPVSGGAYAYGREEVGPLTGFTAGVLFLFGKTASVAAIGLIAGASLWPESLMPGSPSWVSAPKLVAVALVVVLAAVNAAGVRATAAVSAVAAFLVIGVLVTALAGAMLTRPGGGGGLAPWPPAVTGVPGVLAAAALIFFAFAGYARIATLAEEVRDPARTLPRAVVISIAVVLALSAATLGVLLAVLGTDALAASDAPVVDLVGGEGGWLIRAAVAVACIGSMTGVLAGLSRTAMAMARNGDLPGPLARISRRGTPVVADAIVAAVAVVAVLVFDPARVVGLSACAVLFYYGIAHLSALRAGRSLGLPRVVPVVGLIACAAVALSVGWPGLLTVVVVTILALGLRTLGMRMLVGRRRRP